MVRAVGVPARSARGGVFVDPFGEMAGLAARGLQFDYPPITDAVAGTQRGPNTIFVFELGGLRIAHFGDFGQAALRPEQVAAIGTVHLAFLPVGGGPTIGGEQAAEIARVIGARWVVPMHYRTERLNFLEPADEFVARMPVVHRTGATAFETEELPAADGPVAVVLDAP